MPKITFIRHAEPKKDGNLSSDGQYKAEWDLSWPDFDESAVYLTSYLPRSIQTMTLMYPKAQWIPNASLNEWCKTEEHAEVFKERVKLAIAELKKSPRNIVVCGHARFMNWAYWLLKGEPTLGFDYLEGFEHEF